MKKRPEILQRSPMLKHPERYKATRQEAASLASAAATSAVEAPLHVARWAMLLGLLNLLLGIIGVAAFVRTL